jgi:hypothetical protein
MPQLSRLAAALVVALVSVAAAQAQVRSVQPAARVAPSASTRAATAAPNPAGLRPIFPAGVSSGSGTTQTTDPVAATSAPMVLGATGSTTTSIGTTTNGANTTIVTGSGTTASTSDSAFTANGTTSTDGNVQFNAGAATTVLGAAPGYGLVRGPSQTVPTGGAGYSAVDIARSFINADRNRDGELTRGEAGRLSIAMSSFEEMDRNYDGVISRGEYEDGLR